MGLVLAFILGAVVMWVLLGLLAILVAGWMVRTLVVAWTEERQHERAARQAAQVACFRNAAAHLGPGGRFVIEVGVPGLRRLPPGETARVFHVSAGRWGIDEYDVANQGLTSHHFEVVDGRVERFSVPFRYVWPAELDLMAELAGMRLHERWAGWKRERFTAESDQHVSVWEKPRA